MSYSENILQALPLLRVIFNCLHFRSSKNLLHYDVLNYFRTNPAFVEEESADESVTDARRPETSFGVGRRTQLEIPRRAMPPPSAEESLASNGEDESEESEGDSVITAKDSVFIENTNQVFCCYHFDLHSTLRNCLYLKFVVAVHFFNWITF